MLNRFTRRQYYPDKGIHRIIVNYSAVGTTWSFNLVLFLRPADSDWVFARPHWTH